MTPVPERLLAAFPKVIAIAKHFFLNGEVPQDVTWE